MDRLLFIPQGGQSKQAFAVLPDLCHSAPSRKETSHQSAAGPCTAPGSWASRSSHECSRSQCLPPPKLPQEGSILLVLSDKVSLSYSVSVFEPPGDSKIKPKTSPVYLPAVWCQHWPPDNDQDLSKLSRGIYQQLQKQFSSERLLRPFIRRDNQVKLWDWLVQLCNHPPKGGVTLQQGRPSLPRNLCFYALGGCVVYEIKAPIWFCIWKGTSWHRTEEQFACWIGIIGYQTSSNYSM